MIEDRATLGRTAGRRTALACVEAGIQAVLPATVVSDRVGLDGSTLHVGPHTVALDDYDEVIVVGGGKAAGQIARALETVLGDVIDGGIVVTTDDVDTDRIEVTLGDHPLPSARSVESTRRVLERARDAGDRTLVLAVVTGGGSALLAAPAGDLSIEELRSVTDQLLRAGAPIEEINVVRSCLSDVKAGGLARAAAPADVVGIVLSDVIGDDLDVIASGPTVRRPVRAGEARTILDRYDVDVPSRLDARLHEVAHDGVGAPADEGRVTNVILANGMTAIEAARDEARRRDYTPCILSSRIAGEAREAGAFSRAVAAECRASGNPVAPPAVVLSGGETTVTVRGDGLGGPNLEFALAAAIDLPPEVTVAAVDTDGEDGSTAAAGGLVDDRTVREPAAARLALDENDTHPYLADRNGLIRTGPTGTNVNDLRVAVIDPT